MARRKLHKHQRFVALLYGQDHDGLLISEAEDWMAETLPDPLRIIEQDGMIGLDEGLLPPYHRAHRDDSVFALTRLLHHVPVLVLPWGFEPRAQSEHSEKRKTNGLRAALRTKLARAGHPIPILRSCKLSNTQLYLATFRGHRARLEALAQKAGLLA